MPQPFPHLFSPLRVGRYTLRNRIVSTAHDLNYGDKLLTERHVHYHRERARGGVGMIVMEYSVVHPTGRWHTAAYDAGVCPWYRRISDAVHPYDVPILVQLGHWGRQPSSPAKNLEGPPAVAPSAIPPPNFDVPQDMPHELDTEEVQELVRAFGDAARLAREGGLDGVEIAVGYATLVAQFLSPHTNLRADGYGGPALEQRMTFLYEVLEEVRRRLGPELLLGVRMSEDFVDYSLGIEDLKEIAPLLEATGTLDYINVWLGAMGDARSARMHVPPYYYEPGRFTYLATEVKQVVGLPVVGAGRINTPALADQLVAEGKLDMVGMVRALIADPHLPNKARAGQGDRVRRCVACNQSCVGHLSIGVGVTCIYNPVTGREQEWGEVKPAPRSKTVVVVGGGPAGLEAARVAAERGHRVVVFEKERELGGQVRLVQRAPNRESFGEIVSFFSGELARLGVDVRLGVEATAEAVLAEAPDAVVVATGSEAYVPPIRGAGASHVVTARDVLAGTAQAGESVVLIDTQGTAEGMTAADFLSDQGKRVEIVTGLQYVGRLMRGPWHQLYERLLRKGVVMSPFTAVTEIREGAVDTCHVVNPWAVRTIEGVDTVVIAAGGRANSQLHRDLKGRVKELHAVGDCLQPRDIEMATYDGHRVGVAL